MMKFKNMIYKNELLAIETVRNIKAYLVKILEFNKTIIDICYVII